MANEKIIFPEEYIPLVAQIIKDGLKGKRCPDLRSGLLEQVKDLEHYWKGIQEECDETRP